MTIILLVFHSRGTLLVLCYSFKIAIGHIWDFSGLRLFVHMWTISFWKFKVKQSFFLISLKYTFTFERIALKLTVVQGFSRHRVRYMTNFVPLFISGGSISSGENQWWITRKITRKILRKYLFLLNNWSIGYGINICVQMIMKYTSICSKWKQFRSQRVYRMGSV